MDLQTRVRQILRGHQLIARGDSILVVGVSGGADSLALLHVLTSLRADLPCGLHVATFDHRLRGEQSAADAQFVRQTAFEWGLAVTVGGGDVAQLARRRGLSLEAAARQARYDFLAEVAGEVGARRVAVAHHADDQAQTVLLHLLRGMGLPGLAGMALQSPLPGHPNLTLIRPLLTTWRAEIEAYCAEHGLKPREDAGNRDPAFLRVRIRRELLPRLRQFNPQIARALAQLADIAAAENDYIEWQVANVTANHAAVEAARITLARDVFRRLHPALQRRYVRRAAAHIAGSPADMSYAQTTAAVEVALTGQVGARAPLPGGLQLRVDYAVVAVERADAPRAFDGAFLPDAGMTAALQVPGVTTIPGADWALKAALSPFDGMQARLALRSGDTLSLRARRPGDRFAPPGMGGHGQKLKNWMINRKIAQMIRDRVPLVVVNGQIGAIVTGAQWPVSELFSLRDDSERVVCLALVERNEAK